MDRILILDNYDSFTYNLVHYVKDITSLELDVFRNDEISLEDVNKYSIIILSPGPGLPKDAGILKDLIKKYSSTKKILGVCLGMQAIGEVFGGTLKNLSKVFHGVATELEVVKTDDQLFDNLPNKFKVGRYHSWIVDEDNLSKDLIITSKDRNKQIMSIKHRYYKVYGVQFHPESILTEYGKEIINNFLDI
jgi:anthranilate synthase component 2